MDLRCGYKLHGVVNHGVLEVMCRSALCGKKPGVVVMHYFDLRDGSMTTRLLRDPGVVVNMRGARHGLG